MFNSAKVLETFPNGAAENSFNGSGSFIPHKTLSRFAEDVSKGVGEPVLMSSLSSLSVGLSAVGAVRKRLHRRHSRHLRSNRRLHSRSSPNSVAALERSEERREAPV